MVYSSDRLKCVCGKWAKPAQLRIEGLLLQGWKCASCGEEYLSPQDSLRLSAYKQLQASPSQATVTKVGNSLAIRVKKEVVNALGLKPGEKLILAAPSPRKLEIRLARTDC